MERRDKFLYHQIHPLKLAVDLSTSFGSTWLLWHHRWLAAALIALPPSMVVSSFMISTMSFDRQRDSRFGRYLARHMSTGAQAVRSVGQVVAWVSAWNGAVLGVAAGYAIVLLGWTPFWRRAKPPS